MCPIITSPVPFGARVISPLAASVIIIVPDAVPLLVLSIKSDVPPVVTVNVPAPFDLKVAAATTASPTVTVSADSTTSPVPCGVRVIFPLAQVPSIVIFPVFACPV